MTKQTIKLKDLEAETANDTAQATRGVRWGLITATIGLTTMAVVLAVIILAFSLARP